MHPVHGDTFEIALTNATVKDDVGKNDLSYNISELPQFLDISSVQKTADGKLMIEIMGSANSPLTGDITFSVVVKASAVNEAGMADSAPIALTLKKAV